MWRFRDEKGQATIEFLSIFGILMLFFIVAYYFIASEYNYVASDKRFFLSSRLAKEIKQEIDLCLYVEEGYRREYTLPPSLDGEQFRVVFSNHSVSVTVRNMTVTRFFSGEVEPHYNNSKKLIFIKKNGKCLILEQ